MNILLDTVNVNYSGRITGKRGINAKYKKYELDLFVNYTENKIVQYIIRLCFFYMVQYNI